MHPVCRPNSLHPTPSLRPSYHKSEPKIAPSRSSFNPPPIHACTVRWKSSIQHLPTSKKNHSFETAILSPTALNASQKLNKIANSTVKPAVPSIPTSIEQQVYGIPLKNPYTPMTIDDRYPDSLKKRIAYANDLKIPPGSEKLTLSVWDFPSEESDPRFPLFYKQIVAADKYAEDLFLNGNIIFKKKEK